MVDENDIVCVCKALGISRASFYRHRQPPSRVSQPCNKSLRMLSQFEQQAVVEVLGSEQFLGKAPAEIYTTLLNQGTYLCSIRTMYRILEQHPQLKEERRQASGSCNSKAYSLVTKPNQLWLWDIIKLNGPDRYTYYYLYIILDDFSRYVTGWKVARKESGSLVGQLIRDTCQNQQIKTSQLTLHSRRSSSIAPKSFDQLLFELGVTTNCSNSQIQNSNTFCNISFKALQDQVSLAKRFGSLEEAHSTCSQFFDWYNHQHYSQIRSLTPVVLHYGLTQKVLHNHQAVLSAAYQAHPERFVGHSPKPTALQFGRC